VSGRGLSSVLSVRQPAHDFDYGDDGDDGDGDIDDGGVDGDVDNDVENDDDDGVDDGAGGMAVVFMVRWACVWMMRRCRLTQYVSDGSCVTDEFVVGDDRGGEVLGHSSDTSPHGRYTFRA
jgi:hypothetical protein